jgi:hypothetical protein
MFSLLYHQLRELTRVVNMAKDKRGCVQSHLSYARALKLMYMTLQRTQKDMESIYFSYVLKPTLQDNSIVISCLYVMGQMIKQRDQTTPFGVPSRQHLAVAAS